MPKKIFAAMSGGVDSSVAAYLLTQAGYEVTGATMTLYRPEGQTGNTQDVTDARAICEKLGIPHVTYDMGEVFCRCVIEDFIRVYEAGGTPNPCVTCNKTVKFGALWEAVTKDGAEAIATGHYARIRREGDRYLLCKAADEGKDQSYFLWQLPKELLPHILFPLGEMTKPAIRALAAEQGFETAHKSDSQDICFVPDGDYAAFMGGYTGKTPREGDFVDKNGTVLGRHKGIMHYTIGQRKGLGVAFGKPMYVIGIDAKTNRVTLGEEGTQYARALTAEKVNWIPFERPESPVVCEARIRYQAKPAACTVFPLADGTVQVVFEVPQRSVTPGQSVVFSNGNEILGGGIIRCSHRIPV